MKSRLFVSLDLTHAESHRIRVTIKALEGELPSHLEFPVWTPGSYLVREYSRHVTGMTGTRKVNKNTWILSGKQKQITYEVYAFERTVRTSYLDANYAVLVGATLLPLLPGSFTVEIRTPRNWPILDSALAFRKKGPGVWLASIRDSDQWIDSPIVAANSSAGGTIKYRAAGIAHSLTWVGTECAKPLSLLAKDCARICETTIKAMGGAPFQRYTTLLHFGAKMYGGLEHRDSQLSQYDGGTLVEKKPYEDFLGLFAHEYFHAWNVKSLRPEALGPFHYGKENYTEDLWFAEGLTNYFDEQIIHWAGFVDKNNHWKRRCKALGQQPDGVAGHKRRSLAEASFDAWIRYYRPDEDSPNSDVSYYLKGEQLGLCWDAFLQKKSRGRWNLLKLMRALWKEFGVSAELSLADAKPGYTRAELFAFAEKKTKISQAKQLEKWVNQHEPLPWRDALRFFKVSFRENTNDYALHHLGAQIQAKNGSLQVLKVMAGSAAEQASLEAGDEILAVGKDRSIEIDHFVSLLKRHKKVPLLISRLNKISALYVQSRKHIGLGQEIEYKAME